MIIDAPLHPLAMAGNRSGGNGITNGSLFTCDLTGKVGRLDEALQDGDAFVTWQDRTYGQVRWNQITAYTPSPSIGSAAND